MWQEWKTGNRPEWITEEEADCVWVFFQADKKKQLFTNQCLQWLDWKLPGVLTRFVETQSGEGPTFIPTQGRIKSPLLALQKCAPEVEGIKKTVAGMGFKKVLVLSDTPHPQNSSVLQKFKKHLDDSVDVVWVLDEDSPTS